MYRILVFLALSATVLSKGDVIKSDVRLDEFAALINKNDAHGLAELFHPDAKYNFNGVITRKEIEIEEFFVDLFKEDVSNFEMKNTSTAQLGDVTSVSGTWTSNLGNDTIDGTFSQLWKEGQIRQAFATSASAVLEKTFTLNV